VTRKYPARKRLWWWFG